MNINLIQNFKSFKFYCSIVFLHKFHRAISGRQNFRFTKLSHGHFFTEQRNLLMAKISEGKILRGKFPHVEILDCKIYKGEIDRIKGAKLILTLH